MVNLKPHVLYKNNINNTDFQLIINIFLSYKYHIEYSFLNKIKLNINYF